METVEQPKVDTLIVEGLDGLSGRYEFDIVAMLTEGSPDCLTNREAHKVKQMTGIRAGELMDAMTAGDSDVLVALAWVVLTRRGKRVDEEVLWDSPMGSGFSFDIAKRQVDDPDPPTVPGPTGSTETPDGVGGTSGAATAAKSPSDRKATGSPSSGIGSTSDRRTSGT